MFTLKIPAVVVIIVGALTAALNVRAQRTGPEYQLPPGLQASPQGQNPRSNTNANSDAALEIAPRTPAPDASSTSAIDSGALTGPPEAELPPVPTSGPPSSMVSNDSRQPPPYLGISVQRIESHSTPGHDIEGLEIVSVDPNSPAENAGLKGRGAMTKLGATGATAGALMAPLDIALMPLLKKTGQLGQTGDLIVAIDDRRVIGEVDLETALGDSKPGDTIYLTVVRINDDGARKTMKIPVVLGNPLQTVQ